jgi:hypothetical protein
VVGFDESSSVVMVGGRSKSSLAFLELFAVEEGGSAAVISQREIEHDILGFV